MEQPLVSVGDVPESGTVRVDFFGRPALVTRIDGRPRVYLDSCPHLGGPLERNGDRLVCGWHMAAFGLDGRCLRGPARSDSRAIVLPSRVIDGVITYVYTPPENTPGAHEDDTHLAHRLDGG